MSSDRITAGATVDRDQKWQEVVRRLLKHFDDNEGTTYLYDDEERAQFVRETDDDLRPLVAASLGSYHREPINADGWELVYPVPKDLEAAGVTELKVKDGRMIVRTVDNQTTVLPIKPQES